MQLDIVQTQRQFEERELRALWQKADRIVETRYDLQSRLQQFTARHFRTYRTSSKNTIGLLNKWPQL